jgi:hypothetical protein
MLRTLSILVHRNWRQAGLGLNRALRFRQDFFGYFLSRRPCKNQHLRYRHSHESGNPAHVGSVWIPAFAGMTPQWTFHTLSRKESNFKPEFSVCSPVWVSGRKSKSATTRPIVSDPCRYNGEIVSREKKNPLPANGMRVVFSNTPA